MEVHHHSFLHVIINVIWSGQKMYSFIHSFKLLIPEDRYEKMLIRFMLCSKSPQSTGTHTSNFTERRTILKYSSRAIMINLHRISDQSSYCMHGCHIRSSMHTIHQLFIRSFIIRACCILSGRVSHALDR